MASYYSQPKGVSDEERKRRAAKRKKKKRQQMLKRCGITALIVLAVIGVGLALWFFVIRPENSENPDESESESGTKREIATKPAATDGTDESAEPSGEPGESSGEETESGNIDESGNPSEDPTEKPTSKTPEENPNAPYMGWNDPDNGILKDLGIFKDVASLSNKSIPYGNSEKEEDKDSKTHLSTGIFYYEGYLKYDDYHAVCRMKTDRKEIYLTFDEGYENGNTPKILDTLKAKGVKAVFFITKEFLDGHPDYVKRMIDEGHIVGNHTVRHPSGGYPKYVDTNGLQSFIDDVSNLHKLVYDKFGYTMKLFRFPEGEASYQLMAELNNLGYTPVFWSFGYADFTPEAQPDKSAALKRCLNNLGNGAVFLLHAVSDTNTAILGEFIDEARAAGYEFVQIPVSEVSAR